SAMRVVVETADFQAVGFDVPVAEFRTARELARDPAVASLGPDVLEGDFDEAEAVRRVRERGALGIGDALLDQRALAGIGNVFKSEVCFAERVHPFTPVSALDDATLLRLVRTARRFLGMNVRESSGGRMVTYTGLRRTTRGGDPSASLWVYGRVGKPCRVCGERIELERRGLQARGTYFCPRCQALSPV
ncbi:MAG TPA: zinc finger domain-containing protein, partial [Myxococcaceae bacterium]|nr:zinc finger domain-containing protein [Myxococcaceae bacterium]